MVVRRDFREVFVLVVCHGAKKEKTWRDRQPINGIIRIRQGWFKVLLVHPRLCTTPGLQF